MEGSSVARLPSRNYHVSACTIVLTTGTIAGLPFLAYVVLLGRQRPYAIVDQSIRKGRRKLLNGPILT